MTFRVDSISGPFSGSHRVRILRPSISRLMPAVRLLVKKRVCILDIDSGFVFQYPISIGRFTYIKYKSNLHICFKFNFFLLSTYLCLQNFVLKLVKEYKTIFLRCRHDPYVYIKSFIFLLTVTVTVYKIFLQHLYNTS